MQTRFPWETLRSIIGGSSAIDVPRLHCGTLRDAEQFLECYGFNWEIDGHRAELSELRERAIEFIETQLLDDEVFEPAVREETDLRKLLVWASGEPGSRRYWSCAMLRVAHTLAHCRSHFGETYGQEIRSQIFARFEPHLSRTDDGMTLGSGSESIGLVDFDVKASKPTFSVAMKLLHKVENVAEDIFDRVGVRFITRERFDTLLVVKYLREHNVFMFANIKPSRSRNSLIDLAWLEDLMAGLDGAVASGEMTEEERLALLREGVASHAYPESSSPSANRYSASSYRAVQFTCRQLIRVPDGPDRAEIRFFFPFEVQIMDEDAYHRSRSGYAAHDLYKERQRHAVRQRVLGPLIGTR